MAAFFECQPSRVPEIDHFGARRLERKLHVKGNPWLSLCLRDMNSLDLQVNLRPFSVVTFSEREIQLNLEIELFLLTVGGVLSLEFAHTNLGGLIHGEEHPREAISPMALTARQWLIATAVQKGLTNPAISKDFGFSESLVKQEIMQIYRKLQVSERKELVEREAPPRNEASI